MIDYSGVTYDYHENYLALMLAICNPKYDVNKALAWIIHGHKPRLGKRHKKTVARNKEIWELYLQGASVKELCKRFKLSDYCVRQAIYSREE